VDARHCFYPFIVRDGEIIGIGDVPDENFHPKAANVPLADGSVEVWPMTDSGSEKKWRYARQTVESIFTKLKPKMGRKNVQIIFSKDCGTMRSVWTGARYDSSEYGTKLLDKLFGGASFTYPKSLWAVYDCVWAVTQNDKNAIVMDFFSGSATTAHAVMQLNADDNGKRKYIMVQLPEDLDQAAKKAYNARTRKDIKSAIEFLDSIEKRHTICELGKERIRRSGEKIVESGQWAVDSKEMEKIVDSQLDIGFKVLKLDRTPEGLL
jgi:adenine-specific DNA-methyltransferase